MDWTYLGHAMWLVEAAGLRLLFDPQLGETHHAGVFEVFPRREVDAAALRPDLVLVTHRHPDHFDLPSLRRLAALAPDAIVLTPDPLVGKTCQRLGFRHVSLVPARQRIPLDGLDLLTTPSFCPVQEWGVILASEEGTAWNQVDTELRSPADVRAVLADAAARLARPGLAAGPDLGIVRWLPLLEVNAALGRAVGFPREAYARELERIAATGARAVIPGAAGVRHADEHGWMNAYAYPLSSARLRRDLAARCPGVRALAEAPGATYRLRGGALVEIADSGLVTPAASPDDRAFRPLELPPLRDPNPAGLPRAALQAVIEPWLRETLAPAAAAAIPGRSAALALEVVYADGADAWTVRLSGGEARVDRGFDPDYDMLNAVAASSLAAVIEGRAHWGQPLLAGLLRSVDRLYDVDESGLRPRKVPPFFLYFALSYDESTERWVERELAGLGG